MKKNRQTFTHFLALIIMLVCIGGSIFGQAPATLNYQAVLRDADGVIKANESVNIQVSLIQGAVTEVYTELHTVETNAFGLVNLEIGSKNIAAFSLVDWSNGPYYIKISVDGVEMGTTQLLSVPYALYAASGAGEKGEQGEQGPPGEKGEKGDQGDQGTPGVKGDQGDQGLPGDQGIQGEQGEQGPPGVIANNSVSSEHIIDGTITDADIGAGEVGSDEIATDAVGSSEIDDNSVSSEHIIDGTITDADIGAGEVGSDEIATDAVGSSEIEDNSVSATDILNNTIRDADISTSANINISKILGDAGIAYWDPTTKPTIAWGINDIAIKECNSFRMTMPTDGYVLVIHTGTVNINTTHRIMDIGIGTSTTSMISFISCGDETAISTTVQLRSKMLSYSVAAVVPVTGGSSPRFYGLARGHDSTRDYGVVTIKPSLLVGIFIPKDYSTGILPFPTPFAP